MSTTDPHHDATKEPDMEITVLGRHEYVVAPETGLLTLAVEVEAGNRREATTTVTALVTELADALARLADDGGPVSWRSVGPLTTSSWRPYTPNGEPLPPRHGASSRVQARFTDVAALSAFVADWGVREGYQLQGVVWELSDVTRARLEDEALTKAVEDARQRARTIARAAGAADVDPVSFRDPGSGAGHPPVPLGGREMFAARASFDAGPSPIVAEDIAGQVAIEATFRTVSGSPGAGGAAPRRAQH